MTLHKMVNGEKVDLTPEEEAATLAEWAANAELTAKTAYASYRSAAYPSVPEQLDQIYHDGLDAWRATITAVKLQYPKPSDGVDPKTGVAQDPITKEQAAVVDATAPAVPK